MMVVEGTVKELSTQLQGELSERWLAGMTGDLHDEAAGILESLCSIWADLASKTEHPSTAVERYRSELDSTGVDRPPMDRINVLRVLLAGHEVRQLSQRAFETAKRLSGRQGEPEALREADQILTQTEVLNGRLNQIGWESTVQPLRYELSETNLDALFLKGAKNTSLRMGRYLSN